MQELEILYYESVLDDSTLSDHWNITIEDKPFSHGGFGEIFHIINFDGIQPEHPLVLKLFFNNSDDNSQERRQETIERLCDKVKEQASLCKKNGKNFLEEFPALSGLPLCIFTVEFDGNERFGYVMYDLSQMDLIGFDEIVDSGDDDIFYEFDNHDLNWRMTTAFHLVRGFHLLEKMGFLHADISTDNIFVGRTEPMAVIIDYESGAVVESTDDDPTTYGKMQPWLAPEILFQLKKRQKQGNGLVNVNIYSERWAVANAIIQILTTLQAFYLNDLSEKTLRKYNNSYKWPYIDVNDDIFMEGNEDWYNYFVDRCKKLPEKIQKEMIYTFNQGLFNPQSRTSYSRWEMILKSQIQLIGYNWSPPRITQVSHTTNSQPHIVHESNNKKSVNVPDTAAAKEELYKFIDVLIMDIISGNETIDGNKFFIELRAKKAGVNAHNLIVELNDFIEMLSDCRKHKPSQFELKNLRYQGSRAFISSNIVDKIIDKYCK